MCQIISDHDSRAILSYPTEGDDMLAGAAAAGAPHNIFN